MTIDAHNLEIYSDYFTCNKMLIQLITILTTLIYSNPINATITICQFLTCLIKNSYNKKIDPNRLNLLLRKLLPLSVRNWDSIPPIEEVQAPILSHFPMLSAAQPTIGGLSLIHI